MSAIWGTVARAIATLIGYTIDRWNAALNRWDDAVCEGSNRISGDDDA